MWKDPANPWESKKKTCTGDVGNKKGVSTWGKSQKKFPHEVFHIFTKDGVNVENDDYRSYYNLYRG